MPTIAIGAGPSAPARGRPTSRRGPGVAGTPASARNPFFNQNMRIDPAKAEPADGPAPRLARGTLRPRLGPGQDPERAVVQPEVPACPLEIRRRGQNAVLEGQEHLEQPGGSRRRERMPDIRLDRADHALVAAASRRLPRATSGSRPRRRRPAVYPSAWHSIRSTSAGFQPACSYAMRMARSCPDELGASRSPCDVVGQSDPGRSVRKCDRLGEVRPRAA